MRQGRNPEVWIVTGASRGLLGFGSFWEMRELIASVTGLSGATLGRECVTDTKVSISEEKARSVKRPGRANRDFHNHLAEKGQEQQPAFLKWPCRAQDLGSLLLVTHKSKGRRMAL